MRVLERMRHRGQVEFTFPKTFRTQNIAANGAKLHVRDGGSGPAVVLLHGYGETGEHVGAARKRLGPRSQGGHPRSPRYGALR
jgi:pimeloyl-ACP methyl ester carboxylesterase